MRALARACAALVVTAASLHAQQAPELSIERAGEEASRTQVAVDQGYAAVPLALLGELGWSIEARGSEILVSVPGQISIELRVGTPFFRWDDTTLQLVDEPYLAEGEIFVPLQLLTDFLPRRLPDVYGFDGGRMLLRAGNPGQDPAAPQAATDAQPVTSDPEGPRVIVIDAGHGGADPGALGLGGVREKDVALAIALRLAEILRNEPGFEVHLTRDDDTFVDLWDRGEIATNLKGDRPGLFISIHGNSFPDQRGTRGFETYFLSEARTEHERRVAAIENAPLRMQGQAIDPNADPDLGFIFRELANLDYQHWSALLAELAQEELHDFHPGPNRGVKQGVLAVLTNALMPSVLVEVGYLSNAEESRMLAGADFQGQAAEALARSVVRFFERYPPGSGADQ